MKEIKQLKDIYDMEYYLQNECYCPGEIYSFDGFFYQIFDKEDKCEFIGKRGNDNILTNGDYSLICVVAEHKDYTQLLMVCANEDTGKIGDIIRVDPTENNIKLVKEVIENNKTDLKFDEYKKGETKKQLDEIMKLSNGLVMID
ncbi:MAG: hypothetical protein MJ245_00450 [Clostridia bacterium]|nr:hypothetical protein [Clostridia bacterium]